MKIIFIVLNAFSICEAFGIYDLPQIRFKCRSYHRFALLPTKHQPQLSTNSDESVSFHVSLDFIGNSCHSHVLVKCRRPVKIWWAPLDPSRYCINQANQQAFFSKLLITPRWIQPAKGKLFCWWIVSFMWVIWECRLTCCTNTLLLSWEYSWWYRCLAW